MNARFGGSVVLVAGGTGGLGQAVTAAFLEEGAKVVVTDLDDSGGRVVAERIGGRWRRGNLSPSGRKHRGELAGCDRSRRAALWAFGRDGGQRRYWDTMQGH